MGHVKYLCLHHQSENKKSDQNSPFLSRFFYVIVDHLICENTLEEMSKPASHLALQHWQIWPIAKHTIFCKKCLTPEMSNWSIQQNVIIFYNNRKTMVPSIVSRPLQIQQYHHLQILYIASSYSKKCKTIQQMIKMPWKLNCSCPFHLLQSELYYQGKEMVEAQQKNATKTISKKPAFSISWSKAKQVQRKR